MGNIEIDLDVQNKDIGEDIADAIHGGIEEAISERQTKSVGHEMRRSMEARIKQNGRVFTGELVDSFELITERRGDQHVLIVRNDAGHAAAIDQGAEYGAEGPPLHRLIPWVQTKLKGYRVDGGQIVKYSESGGGDTILTDGSGKRPGSLLDLPPDLDVQRAENVQDTARLEGGVNSDQSWYITFEDGENAFFKEYKERGDFGSHYGASRNEVLYQRLASDQDWRVMPEVREGTIIDTATNEVLKGAFMRWVPDSVDAKKKIADGFTPASYDDAEWTTPEFIEDNEDWLARVTVLDFIVGNGDRHSSNMVVDDDNQPYAIDNGGHSFFDKDAMEEYVRIDYLVSTLPGYQQFDEFPNLESAYESLFATQRALIQSFLENNGESALRHARQVHGEQSPIYDRVETLVESNVDDVIDEVRDVQEDFLETNSVGLRDADDKLEEIDLDDQSGILGEINDEIKDL